MATALVPVPQQVFAVSDGLPLHPLVVHAATVLLPLSVLGLVVAVVRPRFRPRLAGPSVLGLAAGAVAAWVAEESGESLAGQVGVSSAHARYGGLLPAAAIVTLIVAAIWWRLQRGPSIPRVPSWSARVAGSAAVATALLTTGLTVLAGHSGAVAVWESKGQAASASVAGTASVAGGAASPTAPASGNPAGASPSGGGGYAMSEVATHNSRSDCWSVVEGTVYDLTSWIGRHPGGPGVVLAMCGVDASAAFRGKHGAAPAPADALAGFAVGPLSAGGPAAPATAATTAPAPAPAPTTRYSRREVATHNSRSDCWSVLEGAVYDLTQWVSRHPGGQEAIVEMCGTDGAGEFLERHAGDAAAHDVLAGYQIGVLG